MNTDDNRHLIGAENTVGEALRRLGELPPHPLILFVVDSAGHVLGAVTDGDVRRGLLAGAEITAPVLEVANRHFTALRPDSDPYEEVSAARAGARRMLPRLDAAGRLIDLIDLERTHRMLPMDAVLMAGGRGQRLRPITDTVPKPLVEVGGKALIDHNVEKLRQNGIQRPYVSINYLGEQVREHFRRCHPDMKAVFVEETEPLGTVGALSLIDDWQHDDILLMNGDLLTDLDISRMYGRHRESGAVATMAVTSYSVAVPFAIIDTEGDRITALKEKPVYNYFANAGVYILRRELVESLPYGRRADAPDLIAGAIASGHLVTYFPIQGLWLDVGTPEQLRRARRLFGG